MKKEPLIKLIKKEEYLEFFDLIDRNKTDLQNDFPNTIKEVATKEAAKTHLVECQEKNQRREKFLFGVYLDEKLMGYINVKNIDWTVPKCELGYFMDQSCHGKGLMTITIKEVLQICFDELKMAKVFLRTRTENRASKRVAEKCGFQKEGHLRSEFRMASGKLVDLEYYGMLNPKDEFV